MDESIFDGGAVGDDTLNELSIDEYFGNSDVDKAIDGLAHDDGRQIDDIFGGARTSAKEAPAAPAKEAPAIPQYELESHTTDPELSANDLITFLHAEALRKGIAGHHIDSMNSFTRIGVKQIVTKVFSVIGRLKNERDKTEEDQSISDISFEVRFDDINLTKPMANKPKTGQFHPLTPNLARTKQLTYSAGMYLDATIEATAIFKDGTKKTRTGSFKNHRIASLPCMLRSDLCTLSGETRESIKEMEEDPNNPGACFIINGQEWTVDCLESNIFNVPMIHLGTNDADRERVRLTYISKPGDAFENSYRLVLTYLNNGTGSRGGGLTFEITTNKFSKLELPYYILFRAMGMTSDRDICNCIVYGVDNTDPVTIYLMKALEDAFDAPMDKKFESLRRETRQSEIIKRLGEIMNPDVNTNIVRKDDDAIRFLNNKVSDLLDKYILTHIGTGIEHRIKKLRFLGHLINKMLRVEMGVLDPSDRDSYKNKRVRAAGISLAASFKQNFNFAIVGPIRRRLLKDFKSTGFNAIQLVESVRSAIGTADLEKLMISSITQGNKEIVIKRTTITNRVSSGIVYHKNDVNVKSTLNQINTTGASAAKQTDRAIDMRRVHPTFAGYCDPSQSPESGEGVGMTRQMTITTSISGSSSSFLLKETLARDPRIILFENIVPERVSEERLAKVFVNGDLIGMCEHAHEIAQYYRMARRHGNIHHQVSIVWETAIREVHFWTDHGRVLRPLIIVYNNLREYIALSREHNADTQPEPQFTQGIKLTRKMIEGLQDGTLSIDDLRANRVIEYISAEEQENTLLAQSIDVLREHEHDATLQFTHCEVEQAIFGIISMTVPYGNHSATTRNTFTTAQRKQAIGWFALNYAYRADKNTSLQHYCERPLVPTYIDNWCYPGGHNAMVALIVHGGQTQEDGIEFSRTSVDCGAWNCSQYNFVKSELEKGEQFGNLDMNKTIDIKKDANYEDIEGEFVRPGTEIQRGHVLIVKTAKIAKPTDPNYIYTDKSIVYKNDEPRRIECIINARNNDDVQFVKVKMRANRPLRVGDKLSSRHGNKGITTAQCSRADMPYMEDGTTPDIMVNAHSIPTRMAINQLIEAETGLLAARRGVCIDATTFKKINIESLTKELAAEGVKYGGVQRAFNGRTGDYMDCLIFTAPTTYPRLCKFVVDEHYAIRTGPTSALTRQPLDGKSNDGGIRCGEMEAWVMEGHGIQRVQHEKLYADSDGIDMQFCAGCNNPAIVNELAGIYKCKYCLDAADIVNVKSSWMHGIIASELSAMNIKMEREPQPRIFEGEIP